MSTTKRIIQIVAIAIVTILCIISYAVKCSAENDDWIPEPDPSMSWDDYISQHPIMTPAPAITPEPTTNPVNPHIPILGATAPRPRAWFRAWHSYPEPDSSTGVTTHMYQRTSYDGRAFTTPLGWSQTSIVAPVNGVYTWDTDMLTVESYRNWRLTPAYTGYFPYTNDIYACWAFRFTDSEEPGFGLDYGYSAYFTVNCPYELLRVGDPETVYPYEVRESQFAIKVRAEVLWDDGYLDTDPVLRTQQYDTFAEIYPNDVDKSVTLEVASYREDRKIRRVYIHMHIGSYSPNFIGSVTSTSNPTRTSDNQWQFSSSEPWSVSCVMDSNPLWAGNQKIIDTLKDNLQQHQSWLSGLFFPTSATLVQWYNNHKDSNMVNGSPVNRYYDVWLSLCAAIYDFGGSRNLPLLKIPALKINIGGTDYQYYDGIQYNIRDADIPVGDQSLFYYSRFVGTICLVGGFVSTYLYKLFKRVYDVKFASGSDNK